MRNPRWRLRVSGATVAAGLSIAAVAVVPTVSRAADSGFIWLTPHTVPGWPVRNDGNWGRTTNFLMLSVDGRTSLINAGMASAQGGGNWTSVYLSDNVTGTLTLASVDPSGAPFPPTVMNTAPVLSPHGTWMAWQQSDPAAGGTTVFARDNRSGQVYRSPLGEGTEFASYVTDDGRVFGRFHLQQPARTLTEVWNVPVHTVQSIVLPGTVGGISMPALSGDGSTAVITLGGQYLAMDLASGVTTPLPIGTTSTTSVGALSQTGRFVGFVSRDPARNPEGLTKNQVYLYDRQNGTAVWVSAPGIGGHTDPAVSYFLVARSVSDDGRYVMFGADSVFTMPPLDPAHTGEHVYFFAGATFERDTRAADTRLLVKDYAYGVAPNAGVVQFDGTGLVPEDHTGTFGVYLSGRPTNRILPPTVSVTGAVDGATYEYGSVPTTGCAVSDGLDGQLSRPAQISGPTGPRAAAGLGAVTASCAYTDSLGLTGEASAAYTIVDTTPPVLHTPHDVTATATSAAGAIVDFPAVTADDAVDGTTAVTCDRSAGTTFTTGTTTITCGATDIAGNSAQASFTVTVVNSLPDAPAITTVVAGNHTATITWLRPADGGSPILGYTVVASPGGRSCSTTGADELTCTITGLTNGVDYTFTVTARNATGSGPPASTPPGQPTTVGLPPAPVTVLPPEPDPNDGTRVTLHWLAAQSDPELPVIGYRATATPGGQDCTTTGELFCTITGLTPGVSYSFTVVAINGVGPSHTTRPDPPTAVATVAGGYGEAVVSWAAPVNTGGAPITGYTAAFGPGPVTCTSTGPSTCTVAGLTPGVTYTVTVTATNAQGTSDPSQPAVVFTAAADTVPPTVTGHPDRSPNDADWYDAPVIIGWSATDPPPSSGPPTVPGPTTVTSEGAGQSATSGPSCDPVGNCATGTFGPVNIDLTPPVITATQSPAPNAFGWTNQPTTVAFACADVLSGVATCPSPVAVAIDGAGQSVTRTAADTAGNTAQTTATVNLDTTPPTITVDVSQAPNGNGWNNADVTVTYTCTDGGSGVLSCPSPVTLTEDGTRQSVSGIAVDRAGNAATATVMISIDRIKPMITATRTAANSYGWNNTDVTVTYTCADALAELTTCPTPATISSEGAGQSTTGVAIDGAGNTATTTVSDINIDKTAPTIAATVAGTRNDQGWYAAPPTVHYTCTDTLSGIASCPTDVVVSTDGAGQSVDSTARDKAGNTAGAGLAGLNVDTTRPLVAVAGAVDGAIYQLNQLPAPSCVTSDATSGVAVAATLTIDRTATGVFTATCAGAVDRAGNQSQPSSVTYTVVPTVETLTGLTNQYVSGSGSPSTNGVIHDLDNKLAHGQFCLYITKVTEQTTGPHPTLTADQAATLTYWARILDPTC